MSSQKGNSHRCRPQKYQNQFAFKNNLHDKSHKTKIINNLEFLDVCQKCKNIIEWKIKYKKYKLLKNPSKCTKCAQKTVKHTYYNICLPCSRELEICSKCGEKTTKDQCSVESFEDIDNEIKIALETMSERKRRTILRCIGHGKTKPNSITSNIMANIDPANRDCVLEKLKSLSLCEEQNSESDNELESS